MHSNIAAVGGRRRSWKALRLFIFALIALIVVITVIIVIIWRVVDPKKLRYSVESGSITTFNQTGDSLVSARIHYVLQATNPNRRISVYYDRVEVTARYEDQQLSVSHVNPFHQAKRNVTRLDLDFTARDVGLYSDVARELRRARAAGEVDLEVIIRARIRLRIGLFRIRRHLRVSCGPMTTPFSTSHEFHTVYCDSYSSYF